MLEGVPVDQGLTTSSSSSDAALSVVRPEASSSTPAKKPYTPGVAPIKAEYLITPPSGSGAAATVIRAHDDDAAESRTGPTKRRASTEGADVHSGEKVEHNDEQVSAEPAEGQAEGSSTTPLEAPKKLKGAARKKAKIAEAQAARAAQRAQENGGTGEGSATGGRVKQKGQNKNRKFSAPGDEFSLCNPFAEGRGCPHGEQCKFSHDIKAYLECKGKDLFLPCPPMPAPSELPVMYSATRTLPTAEKEAFFDKYYQSEAPFVIMPELDSVEPSVGQSLNPHTTCPVHHGLQSRPIWDASLAGKDWKPKCPYGFKCRFLGNHSVKAEPGYGGSGLDVPWAWEAGGSIDASAYSAQDESNFAPAGLQKLLRQKKYDFSKTKAVIAALAAEDREFSRTGVDPARPLVIDTTSLESQKQAVSEDHNQIQQPATLEEEDMDALMNAPAPASLPERSLAEERADQAALSQSATAIDMARIRVSEKRKLDWYHGELYLAPLTTTGNLPFRRLCGTFGSDIHCGEMGLATSYLEGQKSEWSLVRRSEGEKTFGIQLCGSKPELLVPTAEAMSKEFGSSGLDFVDINCGCPIDMVFNHGAGSALLDHPRKLGRIVRGMNAVLEDVPVTIKLRTGITGKNTSHSKIIPKCQTEWGASAVTMHGRSRKQRYSRRADWDYIRDCVTELKSSVRSWNEAHPDEDEQQPIPFYGNGDVYSQQEYYANLQNTGVDGEMIARGALMKPWLFTEIKERRDWDISSRERLDMVRQFCQYGLMHWGSDTKGVQTTRRFLCEALSFWHRYIPLGLLEYTPPSMNDRPPLYRGRDDLETLLSSDNAADWVKISEMFLGKVKDGEFNFVPKHKSNSYSDSAEQQG
ncbi:unnamed protein product [Sympodiomycopsis kandeliae]